MKQKPTYPPLPEHIEKLVKNFHDIYLVKHFTGGTPAARLRSIRNFYQRKIAVAPDKVDLWNAGLVRETIERGTADGIAPDTLYGEIKALKAFIAWQSEANLANGKQAWPDYTAGISLPDSNGSKKQARKEARRHEIFLTVSTEKNRHLQRRADEIDGTRQDYLNLLVERDMTHQDLLSARKLLDSNRKQVEQIVRDELDGVNAEVRAIRELLEKLTGGKK